MGLESRVELHERCQPIELLVTDVDGVMTDGKIVLDDRGVETKHFHVRDGMAFSLWHKAGKQSAILSGRTAPAVNFRAVDLKIAHVLQGHEQKEAPLRILITQLGLSSRQVCYVGDDLPDLPALLAVGLAACPADAVAEVKDAAHLITHAHGGNGAIREIVEVILKSQGKWLSFLPCGGNIAVSRGESVRTIE
jgi:3-deoxy-D-manno-octulosonate 8-phosphate phosphatase (KDO 8-P phosphatase)